jgi:2-keto-3-deoxy-L-rhamnonate aldolase RhmA
MTKNRLKRLIANGQPAIGSWITLPDLYAVEIMASQGFDWLLIDMEHGGLSSSDLRKILVAMGGSTTIPIVRLAGGLPIYFKSALDLGAQGVIVPMVHTAEEAARAVDYSRYPPLGSRGYGPLRASSYYAQFDEYVQQANDEVLLVAQIESIRAVENLESILSTPGVDGIFIGRADLAGSMGMKGKSNHPDVKRVISDIGRIARDKGMPFGLPVWSPEEFLKYAEDGATLMTLGGDINFLVERARAELKKSQELLQNHGLRIVSNDDS